MPTIHRLVIFSHFDIDNIIDDYVVYFLKKMKEVSDDIIFVSTSNLPLTEISKLKSVCSVVKCRENTGYDFMSFKVGLLESDYSYKSYDEVIICNDSVYGPLFDLHEMFETMSSKPCDFWGVTQNNEGKRHLQSYFIVYKAPIIRSDYLEQFYSDIRILETKSAIINEYEIGLTRFFTSKGFQFDCYTQKPSLPARFFCYLRLLHNIQYQINPKYPKAIGIIRLLLRKAKNMYRYFIRIIILDKINPTHFYWKSNLKHKNPFIKIELLRKNPAKLETKSAILAALTKQTTYPVSLAEKHLLRTTKKY